MNPLTRYPVLASLLRHFRLWKYLSEARVKEYLRRHKFSTGRDILFKQALREIKSEMGI